MAKAKLKTVEYPVYAAKTVWAAACSAHRVNGCYVKNAVYDPSTDKTFRPNKEIMREFMRGASEITEDDYKQAEILHTYWRNKLVEILSDTANPLTSNAVAVAGKTEFKANDWLDLGMIAYLPEAYARNIKRDEQRQIKDDALLTSKHFGVIGEKVSGKAVVLESRYSGNWETYYVTATFGTNVMFFSYRDQLAAGITITFTGTVKAHRDDSVTQLNRVRIMK